MLFESTLSKAYYHLYEPLFAARPPPLTLVLSPDLVTSMAELWGSLQHQVRYAWGPDSCDTAPTRCTMPCERQ